MSGFGFHWGCTTYWAADREVVVAVHENLQQYAADNYLPEVSGIKNCDHDYYANTQIISWES